MSPSSCLISKDYCGQSKNATTVQPCFGCRVRKDHWKGMSALERSAIAQQQVQQVAEKKARQQQQLHEDWQYARSQADIARNMASQANQVSHAASGVRWHKRQYATAQSILHKTTACDANT